MNLSGLDQVLVRQRRELAEFLGLETRNKYEIVDATGRLIGFAAEQQKGLLGFILRQWVGHWRRYEIHVFDEQRRLVMVARNPFRFFFQRLEASNPQGKLLGALQQRFSFFNKRFDFEDASGRALMQVSSPLWRPWTFPFLQSGKEVACVRKKWVGAISEMLTDKDNFLVEFKDSSLGPERRLVLVAAALFIDLQYFEEKAG